MDQGHAGVEGVAQFAGTETIDGLGALGPGDVIVGDVPLPQPHAGGMRGQTDLGFLALQFQQQLLILAFGGAPFGDVAHHADQGGLPVEQNPGEAHFHIDAVAVGQLFHPVEDAGLPGQHLLDDFLRLFHRVASVGLSSRARVV